MRLIRAQRMRSGICMRSLRNHEDAKNTKKHEEDRFVRHEDDQFVNQAATLRYRYGGRSTVPIVVRAPSGGNVGGGLYHSQNPEAWFIHRPGLKVVAPSTPYDAKGLLKAAIRDDNPVVYFEHKYLYRRAKGPVPEDDGIVPIGVAATRREGSDVTLLAD